MPANKKRSRDPEQKFDPTTNVFNLVEAEARRQDDLRDQANQFRREIHDLEREHTQDFRTNESHRVDALIANVASMTTANTTAADVRATTLAEQVAASAQASNETLDRRFGPIQSSIEEIRRFQFSTEGGKQQVIETRTHWGVWVAIGVSVFVGMGTLVLGLGSIAVLLYINKTP